MNNWHRKIWTLDPIESGSDILELYKVGAANKFWFEPYVDAHKSLLRFRIEFKGHEMVSNWRDRHVTPHGTKPFDPDGTLDDDVEQLEGIIDLAAVSQPLHIYMDKRFGRELLHILVGDPDSAGAGGGWATAQN
ncbi:MAG: hypothetical protein ABI885_15870 [Gammaproteobacteria bacterium]